MTSSSPARPIRIETLTPQIHGFIRAYVWQVYRGTDPVVDDDPAQQTALLVARAIVRLIGRDREMLRRLTQEVGSYMGAMNPRSYAPSEAFKKLIAEFGGGQSSEAAADQAAAPASERGLAEPAPAQDAPASPSPVEVPTHVPAPVIEPAAAPAIEAVPAAAPAEVAPPHDEPATPAAAEPVAAEPVAEPVAAAEPAAETASAPSAESPSADGKRRRKSRKPKGESTDAAAAGDASAAGEAAASDSTSEAAPVDADVSPQAGGEQSDETTNS